MHALARCASLSALLLTSLRLVAADAAVVSWNNLGMHCMDSDYSVFSILPPYNTIEAQLIVNGYLVTNGSNYTISYEAAADPNGSVNSTSSNKGNFYDYAALLYGPVTVDHGLAGWNMPGIANVPQSMLFEQTNFVAPGVGPLVNWFRAEGIPLTPYDDASQKNPYPMMRIVARDSRGNVIATNNIVLPVSDEMDCRTCHASGSYNNSMPAAGWIYDANPERDYRLNILRLHDEKQFAQFNDLYTRALATNGFNALGLYASVTNNKPILCAICHSSAALGTSGFETTPSLTQSMHAQHAPAPDPVLGITLDNSLNRAACYRCHPGSTTRCLRGAMGAAVAPDGSMAMQCQSCHGTMSRVGASGRLGWLMEPQCQSCHSGTATHNNGQIRYESVFDSTGAVRTAVDSTFATQPNTPAPGISLFRFSSGHGGLQCEACHGSTHAEFPSTHSNDNVRNLQMQGHVGVLVECTVCHTNMPSTANGGPHGMHPVGQGWVNRHPGWLESGATLQQCQTCHGADYRGTVLSKAQTDRTLTANFDSGQTTVKLFRGALVGCYNCHNGPNQDSRNTTAAPVANNVSANTYVSQAVAITLSASEPNLTFFIIGQPAHGSAGLSNNVVTYYPDAGFVGVDSFTFAAYNGMKNSAVATATIGVDTIIDSTAPQLRITSPTSNPTYGTIDATLALGGSASDNVGVATVQWSNDRGGSGTATGTTSWSANVPLQIGVNVITVTATDLAGNNSVDSISVTYSIVPTINVVIVGQGSVTPNLSGKTLVAGRTYTMTAVPSPGWLFANWTGSVSANTPTLTFVMQNSMSVTATFYPGPFHHKQRHLLRVIRRTR